MPAGGISKLEHAAARDLTAASGKSEISIEDYAGAIVDEAFTAPLYGRLPALYNT